MRNTRGNLGNNVSSSLFVIQTIVKEKVTPKSNKFDLYKICIIQPLIV